MKPSCTAKCLRYSTEHPSTSIYNFNEINPEDKQAHQTRTPNHQHPKKDQISSFSTFNLIEIMDRSTRYHLDSTNVRQHIQRSNLHCHSVFNLIEINQLTHTSAITNQHSPKQTNKKCSATHHEQPNTKCKPNNQNPNINISSSFPQFPQTKREHRPFFHSYKTIRTMQ